MATTRISYSLPPNIDVTKAPLAFGTQALPKLNTELQSQQLIVKQRALMSLCDLMHDPQKVYQAISVGCIESLRNLLSDEDSTVRHKATEVLYIAASHNIGRNAFHDFDVIIPLSVRFDDNVEIVRENAHKAISMLSEVPSGAEGVVEAYLIPQLVRKLASEIDGIKCVILNTLHFCARVDPLTCLKSGIMPVLTNSRTCLLFSHCTRLYHAEPAERFRAHFRGSASGKKQLLYSSNSVFDSADSETESSSLSVEADLLQHGNHLVQGGAARVMMDVTVPLEGKKEACKIPEIVPLLVFLLRDLNDEVKANAAGALMTIAITTEGKYTILKANAINELLLLVNCSNSEARLNAIKALTMLAEAPEGRQALLSHVEEVEDRSVDPHSRAVCNAAQIALKVIKWKP